MSSKTAMHHRRPAARMAGSRSQPVPAKIVLRARNSGGHGTRTHNSFRSTTFPVSPLAIRLPSKQRFFVLPPPLPPPLPGFGQHRGGPTSRMAGAESTRQAGQSEREWRRAGQGRKDPVPGGVDPPSPPTAPPAAASALFRSHAIPTAAPARGQPTNKRRERTVVARSPHV